MKQRLLSIKIRPGFILLLLFFITAVPSASPAQNLENETFQDCVVSAGLLSVAANFDDKQWPVSDNGILKSNPILFQSKKTLYSFGSAQQSNINFKGKNLFTFGNELDRVAHYFFKHFNVDNFSSNITDPEPLLKSKVKTDPSNLNDFGLNLSLNISNSEDTIIKMSAIKLESFGYKTYVNALYHYEKDEIEFGLSNTYINNTLLNGMKLEFQANPSAGFGAILLTMSW